MHGHLNLALEDAIGRLERDALDGELRHASQHIGNSVEDALRIHALDTDERIEEFLLVRVPARGDDVVAIARLEFRGVLATACMYLKNALGIDIAHHVVAGDGMATGRNDTLVEDGLVEREDLLAVEVLGEILVHLVADLGLLAADEGDILAPSAAALFAAEQVHVVIGGRQRTAADSLVEFFALGEFVEGHELVDIGNGVFQFAVLKELLELLLSLLLLLAIFAAEYGLDFAFRLGRCRKGEPFGLDVLCARGDDFYLVAAAEFVGQRYEFVVDLCAETVAT